MTKLELIDLLDQFPDDAEVHFSYNYGDHWHTQVAPVVSDVDMLVTKHSDYHRNPILVDEDDVNGDEVRVIVIS